MRRKWHGNVNASIREHGAEQGWDIDEHDIAVHIHVKFILISQRKLPVAVGLHESAQIESKIGAVRLNLFGRNRRRIGSEADVPVHIEAGKNKIHSAADRKIRGDLESQRRGNVKALQMKILIDKRCC